MVQYDDGQQVIMEYNPYWYGKKPQFKKLTFLLLAEDAALAAAKAGEADIVYVPPTFAEQRVEGMSLRTYESIDSRGMMLPTVPSGGKGKTNDIEVDIGNDVTSDLAIRQALNIGLDRQKLLDVALDGHGKKAYCLCDNMPWFNEQSVVKDGDVQAAQEILANGGWVDSDSDGILEKTVAKQSLTCSSAPAISYAAIFPWLSQIRRANSVSGSTSSDLHGTKFMSKAKPRRWHGAEAGITLTSCTP